MHDDTILSMKVQGKVLLYNSRNPAEPPFMTMRRDVTPDLPAILQGLSGRYSPIKSMLFFVVYFACLTNFLLDLNSRIYVQEDNMWSGKGRFTNAVQDCEPIKWDVNDKGDMLLSILTVIISFFLNF
jgi:hypothetical protein